MVRFFLLALLVVVAGCDPSLRVSDLFATNALALRVDAGAPDEPDEPDEPDPVVQPEPDAGPPPCVSTIPEGWTGPLFVQFGPAFGASWDCPSGTMPALDAWADPTGLDLACEACACTTGPVTCSLPGGVRLEYRPKTFDTSTYCSGVDGPTLEYGPLVTIDTEGKLDGQCHAIGPYYANNVPATYGTFRQWADPLVATSTCSAQGGERTGSSATFTSRVKACSPVAADTCAPDTWQTCIMRDGAADCPAGYASAHVAGDEIHDDRACGACGCESVPGTCQTMLLWYPTVDCSGVYGPSPFWIPAGPGEKCSFYSGSKAGDSTTVIRAMKRDVNMQGSTSCTVSQDPPTGSVTIAGKHTICCAL